MVWPLWKRAWGGQRGLRTWVSLKSAMKGPRSCIVAERESSALPSMVDMDEYLYAVSYELVLRTETRVKFKRLVLVR